MFLFSPEKLLVILAVAMVVLGPDKLPKLAGQLGALWRDLHNWRERLEHEARGIFPDLPPLETIGQAVRSPLSYLDRLADAHSEPAAPSDISSAESFVSAASVRSQPSSSVPDRPRDGGSSTDNYDPSLN